MRLRQWLAVGCAFSLWIGFVSPAQAVLNADVNAAKSRITTDSILISQWVSDQLKIAVPFNSTAGNVVPKQLKLFGVEFGVEGVASGTKMDVDAFHNLGTSIVDTKQITVYNRLPMPAVLGHAKLGLPWGLDAGVRIGGIPSTTADNGTTHFSVSNSIFGIDVRKKIIEEGIAKPFGLTVGANFTRAKGSIDVTTPYNSNLADVVLNGTTYKTSLSATGAAHTDWDTKSVGVQAILNKQILFFNPYVGASANKNFGSVNTSITNTGTVSLKDSNGNPVAGAQDQDLGSTVGSASATPNEWDIRGLVGFELSILPFLKLGVQGEYAGTRKLAGAVGLRAQFR